MGDLAEWVGLDGYTPEQWQAFGTMLTAFIAAAAALFARQQVKHARELRDEQAQPNVVVDFELTRSIFLNLVVRNTGLTVAYDVMLKFDPPLLSTFDDQRDPPLHESDFMTKGIPTMPPGRTWTALFESGAARKDRTDLPRTYDVTVTYRDKQKRKYSLSYRLDLDIFFGIWNVNVLDTTDAVKALRDIKKTFSRWTEGHHGLAVFTRDGAAKDREFSDWIEEQKQLESGEQPSQESSSRLFKSRRRSRGREHRREGD